LNAFGYPFWEFHVFAGTKQHLKKYKQRDQDLASWQDSVSIEFRSSKWSFGVSS